MPESHDPAGPPSFTPVPRRNIVPPAAASVADPSAREQLADIVDSVKVLADQLHQGEPTDPADPAKTRAARRQKKFQRSGQPDERRAESPPPSPPAAEPSDDPLPDAEVSKPDDAASNRNIAWPRLTRPNVPTTLVRTKRKRRSTTIPLLVLMACNLVMLVLGYFVGTSVMSSARPAAAVDKPSGPAAPLGPARPDGGSYRVLSGVSDTALDAADDALRAEKNGDAAVAKRVYDDALRLRLGLWGAEYRLALLSIKRGDLLDADLHLAHSTEAGECLASCAFVRATFAGAKGNYAEAVREATAAAHAEPFNGKYFFCWGECLRRQGKPRAALHCFQEALTRPFTPEDGDLYLFKTGLANVEAGADEAFNASLASHLQTTDVPGDWWLLAAAQDLEHAAFPAAADHLQKAAKAMPAAVYESRVRDFFFQAFVKRPGLAALLGHPPTPQTSAAGASVMDPAAWPAEKADPGAWPSAAR